MKAYSHYRCLVFDVDGTLVQTNQLIFDAFNHIAERYVHRIYTPSEIIALFGPPEEDVVRAIVGEERAAEAMEEYLRFYRSYHKKIARLHDGIEFILRTCKEHGKILAVFTGKGRATTRITLEECGIVQYFDMIVTGDDVRAHKPSPEGLQKIMERYALQPSEMLLIGDAPADVTAARKAGIHIAAALWDSYAKETMVQMKTDFVFHRAEELQLWMSQYVC